MRLKRIYNGIRKICYGLYPDNEEKVLFKYEALEEIKKMADDNLTQFWLKSFLDFT
ncbi:hypothetical protein TTE1848 [Caldanaerobacter subterraneus subsp. tengcongensis MB4]|uniref:Uncharacterized protein n=1 Tax=Caldanaerobacter subterraneus subsp. tengcongensis (strain DSM 15242 / JCM 11007 / NBRC 100824 / MB4) TaxID=273068 RepID=Q8R8Y6_CALS4|nr:hypothetical protein TTE1848 [Caldanaerobacter subterraneus subsp. tengcongensis MB4]